MKKIFTVIAIILTAVVIASLYGIINDQLTYTISPEYYTKFKFYQFRIIDTPNTVVANPRQMAVVVGIMATWWMGLLIGLVFGLFALTFKNQKHAFGVSLRAMVINITITFCIGLAGLLLGYISLGFDDRIGFYPYDVEDPYAFEAVGSMHNFSYAGGVLGLVVGIAYIVWKKRKTNNPTIIQL